VTTIADTGDSGAAISSLAELGGSGVAYLEVFGPHPNQLEASFTALVTRGDELSQFAGKRIRLGVSPHAPYTVSGPLFSRVAGWARERGYPLAVHVAESEAESAFVTRREGRFAEAWRGRGIPLLDDPAHLPPGRRVAERLSPIHWLSALGVLSPATLCIHAIRLSEDDVGVLAESGAAVAHCPVSNARHGHAQAPLGRLLAAGVPVGLGTDSVASVGKLDLFETMRAARGLAGLSDQAAVELGTIRGARAIGLDREIGTLTPGKWGDVIAIRTAAEMGDSPWERVTGASPEDCVLTVLGGRVVYRATR
jgi:5-methylthioadenosine/S-adenosylhomocysteine deaminase